MDGCVNGRVMNASMVGLWMCQWNYYGCVDGRIMNVSMVRLWMRQW